MCNCIAKIIFAVTVTVLSTSAEVTNKQYGQMPTLFEMDDFDRCMYAYGDETLYCMITFQLSPEDPQNPSEVWNIINEVSSNPKNYRHDLIRHGICVPKTCPNMTHKPDDTEIREHVQNCYNRKYRHLALHGRITDINCQNQDSPYPIDNFDIIVGVFLVTYVIFVICCSFYEGIARYKTKEEYDRITGTTFGRYISAFSIPKNWLRLKNIDIDNPDIKRMRAIQGVRFYNICLVIVTHTVMGNVGAPVSNPRFTESIFKKIPHIFMANGGFAVQTFFLFSGWMMSYHFFVTFENKKEVKPKYLMLAFLNRYVRLTPTLAVVIALNASWFVRLQRGPLWDVWVGQEYRKCRADGWANILYITNFQGKVMCMAQTWYMAIDTQFFLTGLFVVTLMWKYQNKIWLILGSMIAAHVGILFTIIYWNDWEATFRPLPEDLYELNGINQAQWHVLLASYWANIPGYVIGLGLGYIYYKIRDRHIFDTKMKVTIWWMLCWSMSLGIIVIPGLIMDSPGYQRNRLYAAIYGSVSKIVFSIGIGLATLGMTQGIGWGMKWTSEWSPTYVLGRLTYSAFLAHMMLIRNRAGSRRHPTYLADEIIFTEAVADVFLAHLMALFLTLLFELPISELQKWIVPQPGKERDKAARKIQDGVNVKKIK